MDRNPDNGWFLEGNQVAVGNKGNQNPKWGNKNAVKHGFFASYPIPKFLDDDRLVIPISREKSVIVEPEHYFVDEEGRLRIHDEVADQLEAFGIKLMDVE